MRKISILLLVLICMSATLAFDITTDNIESNMCDDIYGTIEINSSSNEVLEIYNENEKLIFDKEEYEINSSTKIEYTYKPECEFFGKRNVKFGIKQGNLAKIITLKFKINQDSNEQINFNELSSDYKICNQNKIDLKILNLNGYDADYQIKIHTTGIFNETFDDIKTIKSQDDFKIQLNKIENKTSGTLEIELFNNKINKSKYFNFDVKLVDDCLYINEKGNFNWNIVYFIVLVLVAIILILALINFAKNRKSKNKNDSQPILIVRSGENVQFLYKKPSQAPKEPRPMIVNEAKLNLDVQSKTKKENTQATKKSTKKVAKKAVKKITKKTVKNASKSKSSKK